MSGPGDRGSTTAELAVAMPVLVLLVLFAMTGVSAVVAQLRCFDAAREVALAEARGERSAEVGRGAAPAAATISISTEGELIRVVVRVPVHPFGSRLPGFTVEGSAVSAKEPVT